MTFTTVEPREEITKARDRALASGRIETATIEGVKVRVAAASNVDELVSLFWGSARSGQDCVGPALHTSPSEEDPTLVRRLQAVAQSKDLSAIRRALLEQAARRIEWLEGQLKKTKPS
ncbi:MAG: hypothetical protein Q7R60_02645 [bacterium]|nr:hypothetical protein [bacterium]